jgi:hypothetical protein
MQTDKSLPKRYRDVYDHVFCDNDTPLKRVAALVACRYTAASTTTVVQPNLTLTAVKQQAKRGSFLTND